MHFRIQTLATFTSADEKSTAGMHNSKQKKLVSILANHFAPLTVMAVTRLAESGTGVQKCDLKERKKKLYVINHCFIMVFT